MTASGRARWLNASLISFYALCRPDPRRRDYRLGPRNRSPSSDSRSPSLMRSGRPSCSMLGGRRLITPLTKRVGWFRAAMGIVMIVFGIGMAASGTQVPELDRNDDLPAIVGQPGTKDLESSDATENRLDRPEGRPQSAPPPRRSPPGRRWCRKPAASDLPVIGKARSSRGTQEVVQHAGRPSR